MRDTTAAVSSGWSRGLPFAFGLALCVAPAASAAPATVAFVGTVRSLVSGPNAGIAVGMPVVGYYTFEGSTPGSCVTDACSYIDAIGSFSMAVPAASALAQGQVAIGGSEIRLSRTSQSTRCTIFGSLCVWSSNYQVGVHGVGGGFSLSRATPASPRTPPSLALPLGPPSCCGTPFLSVTLADGSVFSVTIPAFLPSSPDPSDIDGDSVPNTTDDCPVDVNPLQENADGDWWGDACDPFPTDRNNPRAQCVVDLETSNADLFQAHTDYAQAQLDLPVCQAQRFFNDSDGDGEEEATDRCAGTRDGSAVDAEGCSLTQFCASRTATCKKNDWLNDEPGVKKPRDCTCP